MVIDFTKQNDLLTEDYLKAVGAWSKWLLGRMFGDNLEIKAKLEGEGQDVPSKPDFIIRGKYRDVQAYAQALGREKDYIVAYSEYGEEHPITAKAKAELDKASNRFERLTGIMWPFK